MSEIKYEIIKNVGVLPPPCLPPWGEVPAKRAVGVG
jgi:hypothetical protein